MLLAQLETPRLIVDAAKMQHNIDRMQARMNALGVRFRPHAKTSKCAEVVRRQLAAGARAITVSTLKEAEQFAAVGVDDILYAVGIVPAKLDHALRLAREGVRLTLLVESIAGAAAVARHGAQHAHRHHVMIEIDTDGHRSGVRPDDPQLIAIADALRANERGGAFLAGVMTHAGSSYALHTTEALEAMAEQERSGCVRAAARLRDAGHASAIVSVGSTPTALRARSLDGVTEVRAGVYVFFDLVMANVGVCTRDEIALSVLCSVIGHRADAGLVIVDAGWMAMSRDRGTQKQPQDFGYGAVCDVDGNAIGALAFDEANQEHGVLRFTGDGGVDLAQRFPLGTPLRILPNHACATAAQFDRYTVLGEDGELREWPRFGGW